jgi:hypothetical protein
MNGHVIMFWQSFNVLGDRSHQMHKLAEGLFFLISWITNLPTSEFPILEKI